MDQVLLFPGYDFRFTPDMEELCEVLHPKLVMDQLLETLRPYILQLGNDPNFS